MENQNQRQQTIVSTSVSTQGAQKLKAAPLIGVGLGLALGLYGLHISRNTTHSSAGADESQAHSSSASLTVTVEAASLTASPIIAEIAGTVHAELESPLSSKVMARVMRVAVREGDHVKKGQALIWLDAMDLDASVRQAAAGLIAASAGYNAAQTAARMERAMSAARMDQAKSRAAEADAALQAAKARLDLVLAGPRRQEKEQANQAVSAAKSAYTLAAANQKRMEELFSEGAISAQQLDQVRTAAQAAEAQYQSALQGKSLADEGSRAEEIRAARQALRLAQAGVQEAASGIKAAEAAAMQTALRQQEAAGARAQVTVTKAGLDTAKIALSYATITAPFDGVVTRRMTDPGAMASPGLPLLTVQGGKMRLEAAVPESVLGHATVGTVAPISISQTAAVNEVPARVVEIAPQGDPSSHTFTVKFELPDSMKAAAGTYGKAKFTTGFSNQISVPSSAIIEREGLKYLYVVDGSDMAHLRMVTTGSALNGRTAVLSGLNPGEKLIAKGAADAADGAHVRSTSSR